MIKSMTGFGKATVESGDRKIIVEVKSLNSKQVDISLRMPNLYKEKEMEIRNIIKNFLERGKIDMTIYFDNADTDKDVSVNQGVVEQYFKQMLDVASSLGVETNNNEILQTVMRFPETLKQKTEELDEGEWERLKTGIEKALEQIDQFRIQEGRVLVKEDRKSVV